MQKAMCAVRRPWQNRRPPSFPGSLWIALHCICDSPRDIFPRPRLPGPGRPENLRRRPLSRGTAAWPCPALRMNAAPLSNIVQLLNCKYPIMALHKCQEYFREKRDFARILSQHKKGEGTGGNFLPRVVGQNDLDHGQGAAQLFGRGLAEDGASVGRAQKFHSAVGRDTAAAP